MSRTSNLKLVRLDSLQPHPKNQEIYRDNNRTQQETDELTQSIKTHGLWEGRITVHKQTQTILHGHRRIVTAMEMGTEEAIVTMVDHLPAEVDDPEVLLYLLNDNTAREKTNAEKLREFEVRKAAEAALANRRMATKCKEESRGGPQDHTLEKGKARDIAARKCGLGSGSKAEKALKALKQADELEASEPEKAQRIKNALNSSLTTGIKTAQRETAQPIAVERPTPTPVMRTKPLKVTNSTTVTKVDGKRLRNIHRCRKMEGFTAELEYLRTELPKALEKAKAAERHLRKITNHSNEHFVEDRGFAEYMTVWAQAWLEDGTINYSQELSELQAQCHNFQGQLTTLQRLTVTNEVMISRDEE